MGANHVRLVTNFPGMNLVGVYDTDHDRSNAIATTYGTTAFTSTEQAMEAADACILATPTVTHASLAKLCLDADKCCLIEKPITLNLEEANILSQHPLASSRIMVGHTERYNPVVKELKSILANHQIYAINIQRLSYSPHRGNDMGVVLDLMSHDLDILSYLFEKPITIKSVSKITKDNSQLSELYAQANIDIEGAQVNVIASKLSHTKKRHIEFSCEDCFIEADLLNRTLFIKSNNRLTSLANSKAYSYRHLLSIEQVFVPIVEPLWVEYKDFSRLIYDQEQSQANIYSSIETLSLCYQVLEQANRKPE